ncbi:MAG: hypothetical protein JNN13_08845 [Planctomycetes bacterium]|nr:hypothetical protein [Planctomycetota bacterium]
MSTPSPFPAELAARRWPWSLPLVASALAGLWFTFAVAQRLPYPHELEWMEGALVDHASRIADGLPLYCEPGPEHVPFLYAPLLFWLGGLGMKLGIDGLLALRLIATGFSLGCGMLIGHWVRRESGDLRAGLVASGTFLAGYGWLAWWYDLARNDSLFVFGCLATAYQLRHGGHRRWLWAALLATLAVLAKQSALMWLPAIAVGALIHDPRTAWRFAATALPLGAAVFGAMHWCSDGWSTFYLFEMPRHHGIDGSRKLGYWTEDVQPMLPLLLLGLAAVLPTCRAGRWREALFLAAFGSGGLLASWFSRLHVGGFDNVMMYGFAAACVLGPLAAVGPARWLRRCGPWLLLVQFLWLGERAWQRGPATLLPTAAHRQAHEQLEAFVAAQPGPVWIPAHGRISHHAGKGTGAHGQAIFDLLQLLPKVDGIGMDITVLHDPARLAQLPGRGGEAVRALMTRADAALRERHFAAIVIDEAGGTSQFPYVFAAGLIGDDLVPNTNDDPYVRSPAPLLREPAAIRPLLGFDVHSPYALVRR